VSKNEKALNALRDLNTSADKFEEEEGGDEEEEEKEEDEKEKKNRERKNNNKEMKKSGRHLLVGEKVRSGY
jgi:hypothetical protein